IPERAVKTAGRSVGTAEPGTQQTTSRPAAGDNAPRARTRYARTAFAHRCRSDAGVGRVRPLALDGVRADLLGLPGADVADLAVGVVVPPLPGDRVGDRFAQLVRASRRERVQRRQAAGTARAAREGHDGVKDPAVDVAVVAAEHLARARPALDYG